MTIRLLSKTMLRLTALFWLGALAAAPAVAEVACIQEEAAHLQSCSVFLHETVASPDDGSGSADTKVVGHCAFGHGACGGILQSAPEAHQPAVVAPEFIPAAVRELLALAREGQERPPKH